MPSHLLRLNDLILSAGDDVPDDRSRTWWWDVYGQDFSTGASEPIETTMRTLLQDGARVVTQGYGNREVTFLAVVGGVDSAALAAAEQDLARNLGRRGELGWTPPDGWGPETVFDIETSSMTAGGPEDDDELEVESTERVYQLRFVCQPFVRPAEEVSLYVENPGVMALDEDVVDPGNTMTRWSAQSGSLRDRGTFLDVVNSRTPQVVFTAIAPIDLTTQPFVSLVTGDGGTPVCDINGVRATLVGSEAAGTFTSGTTRFRATRWIWRTEETSLVRATFFSGLTAVAPFAFQFKDLRVRNLPPYSGTQRQSRRSIAVAGSVRTQGTLEVAAREGQALGTLIFYSTTAGLPAPSLRGYRLAGATPTPRSDAVSGFVESLGGTGASFVVPVKDLTAGKTQIVARLYGAGGTETITWTARTRIAGEEVGPTTTGTTTVAATAGQYRVVALGTADLPPSDLPPESDAEVLIKISGGHLYDEVWLMNLDDGAVTIIEAGTRRYAWIETASTARPRPAIYIGNTEDRSDAFHDPSLIGAWGTHEFAPPLTTALIVTSGSEAPEVRFRFYPRFMNFVANLT